MSRSLMFSIFIVLVCSTCQSAGTLTSEARWNLFRGGSSVRAKQTGKDDAYRILAEAILDRLPQEEPVELEAVQKALASLSSAQKALKGLDGAAHEAYQRTHHESSVDTAVKGRASRSASRAGATADALLSAELCELLEEPALLNDSHENSTLAGRQIVLNITSVRMTKSENVSVLVLYEPDYSGGAGLEHGGVESLTRAPARGGTKRRGRLIVIVGDGLVGDLRKICTILGASPMEVGLHTGLVANELASVQGTLYRTAGRLLQTIEPTLRAYNESAIHFVGRSLAGGVASLSATILDGSLPLPPSKSTPKKRSKKRSLPANETTPVIDDVGLEGLGCGRSSAMVLGAPPCLSANVKAAFVKSIILGDDVVCRTTKESLDRLCSRTMKAAKGGILGRRLGWMTDTVSLTMSSLKSHAHGSEGEEARLVVPGRAFLIRPRRLGGTCSMHEVGASKGGREALRAAVLWQLHDVLLSRSLWKHHQLDSYIHGLDRVNLRGFDEKADEEEYY